MGSGRGQGGQSAGMAGSVPPGGIASMLGQMPPGMGGPLPQQGGMMGGQQAAQQAMQQFGQQQGGFMGGNPATPAPGGAQFSAMNFTPRPATMGLDGMPIQRANDPQMLAQMQATQQQGGMMGQMPPGGIPSQSEMLMQAQQGGPGMGRPGFSGPKPSPAMMGGQMPQGGPGMGRPISPRVPSTMQRGLPQGLASMFGGRR